LKQGFSSGSPLFVSGARLHCVASASDAGFRKPEFGDPLRSAAIVRLTEKHSFFTPKGQAAFRRPGFCSFSSRRADFSSRAVPVPRRIRLSRHVEAESADAIVKERQEAADAHTRFRRPFSERGF
jgi:hypothetical protein